MAKNYVISDTLLLGATKEETLDTLSTINNLRLCGSGIILLSNRPYKCMKHIRGNITDNGLEYYYQEEPFQKGSEYHVDIAEDKKIITSQNLGYDYTIFGNGIMIFDKNDNPVHTGEFIDKETLGNMESIFEKYGFKAPSMNYCFGLDSRVYKYFRPDDGHITASDDTYGMQIASNSAELNQTVMSDALKELPHLVCYNLNNKPCFYQKRATKLTAFEEGLLSTGLINVNETAFFLGDITEAPILEKYGDISTVVSQNSGLATNISNTAPSLGEAIKRTK